MNRESRQKRIEEIVSRVEDWSLEALVEYAKDQITEYLENLSDKELDDEYQSYLEIWGEQ